MTLTNRSDDLYSWTSGRGRVTASSRINATSWWRDEGQRWPSPASTYRVYRESPLLAPSVLKSLSAWSRVQRSRASFVASS